MTIISDLLKVNFFELFILFLVVLVLALILGVMLGNITSMKILTKLGVSIFSSKPEKDFLLIKSFNRDTIGWISIPDTCYAPIMSATEGKYISLDWRERENKRGEIYLAEGNAMNLSKIAKEVKENFLFKDLSIIKGSASARATNIRDCKFTFLKKYTNTELQRYYPDIILIDNGHKRVFNLLFAVDLGIENRKRFVFTDRESFIRSVRKLAFMDTGREAKNNIVILNGVTSIDSTLVFLVEKD